MKPFKLVLLFLLLFPFLSTDAQYANFAWRYDGFFAECVSAVKAVDGGYIYLRSVNDYDTNRIFKVDDAGVCVWMKAYQQEFYFRKIRGLSDSTYIVTAIEKSDVFARPCVLKLDDSGEIIWQKNYPDLFGWNSDYLSDVTQTSDGGFIVVGCTHALTGIYGDFWIIKMDSSGNTQWEKTYGGTTSEGALSVVETVNNEYLVFGDGSSGGDISFSHGGTSDCWLIKLDANGGLIWEKTYGGSENDDGHRIIATSDGNFLLMGSTTSDDGDISFFHGASDIWLIKIDTAGNVIWEKTYGGTSGEFPGTIKETQPGKYTMTGRATNQSVGSINGDLHCTSWDGGWVFEVDNSGQIIWQKQFHGYALNVDYAAGQYILQGHSKPMFSYSSQYFLAALELSSTLTCDSALSVEDAGIEKEKLSVYPTITSNIVHVDFPEAYPDANIELFDLVGKKVNVNVAQHTAGKYEISIGNIPPAMYILSVTANDTRQVFKIVYQP